MWREQKNKLPSTGSLWQRTGVGRAEARTGLGRAEARNLIQIFHMNGKNSTTCVTICYLTRCAPTRTRNWKPEQGIKKGIPKLTRRAPHLLGQMSMHVCVLSFLKGRNPLKNICKLKMRRTKFLCFASFIFILILVGINQQFTTVLLG